ncbi:splicing factor Cactin [Culicoides brevitarsis]|uniref:splicing factor Cactin n=1 Tax=Culicoides brevitarsis TaxID=469753 RepID=UPI00307B485E
MGWGDPEDNKGTFVWGKKLEKQGIKNISKKELERINRRKQQENMEELEKIKKRRLEIERQKAEREEEAYQQQRMKEAAQFDEWQKQEEKFHLEQAKLRSKIRINDGRAKPIDLLAQYISDKSLEESIEMQVHEPYTYLNGLSIDDFEDLLVDIKVYNELEKRVNAEYWEDLTIICEDELKKLRKLEQEKSEYRASRREGIHESVAKDVTNIFKGKSAAQLHELQTKIEHKINSKLDGVDIGYWESLLSQLRAHMARARLKDSHQRNLKKKLELLKREQEEQVIKKEEPQPGSSKEPLPGPSQVPDDSSQDSKPASDIEMEDDSSQENPEMTLLEECFAKYEKGNYSPRYISFDDIEPGMQIIPQDIDEQNICDLRAKLFEKEDAEQLYSKEELLMRKEARKGMGDDESQFSVESRLDEQVYLWSDKYRPRKPRYFNRVHTGFEWNKYNQTHYDMDNPPPKIVQGYKFNIFYPDLIDKQKTPQYFLTPCFDNPDFAILRIHAGPPYEDIAFKIVNREWEFSYKRGFRCQFHNNIFQLWFHFKRYRYRR